MFLLLGDAAPDNRLSCATTKQRPSVILQPYGIYLNWNECGGSRGENTRRSRGEAPMTKGVYRKGHKQVAPLGRWGRAVLAMIVVLLSGTTLLAAADAFQPYGTLKRSLPRHLVGL